MSRGTCATMDPSALQYNLQRVKALAPKARIWAVVKADGYGHGAVQAAQALHQADGFAVASLAEAQTLRDAGIEASILLLEGTLGPLQALDAVRLGCDTAVHQTEQLAVLEAMADRIERQVIWLKVDTGMHRLGVNPEQVPDFVRRIQAIQPGQAVNLMTHFASADQPETSYTALQIDRFNQLAQAVPGVQLCLANSAGVMAWPDSHADWVRPGIMLYGASPGFAKTGLELGLRPVMQLTAPVIALRTVPAGDWVGYGARWQASRPSRIATLAIGYGDGYPRHAPDNTPVWLGGQRVPLVGKVSMDMITVDVTDIANVQLGDSAELWGEHLSVDEVASHIGTVGYELLTRVSPRVDKKWPDA
ncbi:alanine racemase [Saccharospirillum impatiens]|uniref:alanine racemase n=1 Tax=Saccharospirillum impatiens TaxID=169438 RepID=UPI00048A6773|nr:alanine racemase [Saccharospirillum impatiens]